MSPTARRDAEKGSNGAERPDLKAGFERFLRQSAGGMWDELDDRRGE